VTDPRDYPWSSYRANALGIRDPIVSPRSGYQVLGADTLTRHNAYRALCNEMVGDTTLELIRVATNKGCALGSEQFHATMGLLLNRRTHAFRGSRAAGPQI